MDRAVRAPECISEKTTFMWVVTVDGVVMEPQNEAAAAKRVEEAIVHHLHGKGRWAPGSVIVEKVTVRDRRDIIAWHGGE